MLVLVLMLLVQIAVLVLLSLLTMQENKSTIGITKDIITETREINTTGEPNVPRAGYALTNLKQIFNKEIDGSFSLTFSSNNAENSYLSPLVNPHNDTTYYNGVLVYYYNNGPARHWDYLTNYLPNEDIHTPTKAVYNSSSKTWTVYGFTEKYLQFLEKQSDVVFYNTISGLWYLHRDVALWFTLVMQVRQNEQTNKITQYEQVKEGDGPDSFNYKVILNRNPEYNNTALGVPSGSVMKNTILYMTRVDYSTTKESFYDYFSVSLQNEESSLCSFIDRYSVSLILSYETMNYFRFYGNFEKVNNEWIFNFEQLYDPDGTYILSVKSCY